MFGLLYFIESNDEYQKFMDFVADGRIVDGSFYLIFNEDVHSKDGRVFRVHNKILVAVKFTSSRLTLNEIIAGMVEFDLDSNLMVNHYDLTFSPNKASDEKAKQIILEMKLIAFLNDRDFRFKDGSILSMSKLSRRIVEVKKRLGIPDRDF